MEFHIKNIRMNIMDTKSAIQAMLDGKKVRDTKWTNQHEYLYIQDGDIMCEKGIKLCNFNISGIWEIYEEPKPKQVVVIEKWLCEYCGGYVVVAGNDLNFMRNERFKKVKLLDTYEVTL